MGEGEVRQRKKKSQHSSSQSAQQKTSHKGDGKSKKKQGKDYQAALAMLHDLNDDSVGNKFFTRGKLLILNLENIEI